MIYYSFYLDRDRTQMVYRTEDVTTTLANGTEVTLSSYHKEINTLFEPDATRPKTFDSKESAEKDFWKLLYDNPDYRIGTIFGIKKEKGKKSSGKNKVTNKTVEVKVSEEIRNTQIIYTDLERNKVYNEKCEETMKRMPISFVDHIITSPPYNAEETYKDGKRVQMYEMYQDNLSDQQYEEWLFMIIRECIRVSRMHVFFNIQMLGKNKRTVCRIFGEFAPFIKDRMVWVKSIVAPHIQPGVLNSGFEDVIIFSKDRPELKVFSDAKWNQGSLSNVLKGINASGNKHAKLNKATFPLYFPRTILNYWGKKGELIYDPFNGTGTTGDACVIEHFDYIASEIDPIQCEITNQRIKDRTAKLTFNFGE